MLTMSLCMLSPSHHRWSSPTASTGVVRRAGRRATASRGRWPTAWPPGSSSCSCSSCSGSSRAYLHHLLHLLRLPHLRPLRLPRKTASSRRVSPPTRHYTRRRQVTLPPPASHPMTVRWPTSRRRRLRLRRPRPTLPRLRPLLPPCSREADLQPRPLSRRRHQLPPPPTTDPSPTTTTSTTAPTRRDAPPPRRHPTRWPRPRLIGAPRCLHPAPLLLRSGAPLLTP